MARGTAHQVELLRAEVGTALQAGLEEIRNNTDSLRTELNATLAAGLSEHRDEFFEAIAREQQEASRAHQDNRGLHRQLGNLRAEVSALQNSIRSPLGAGHGESPPPTIGSPEAANQPTGASPEADSQDDAVHSPGDDSSVDDSADTTGLPAAEPPASEQAAELATPTVTGEAAESDSEETTVSEPTPADSTPVTPHVLTKDQLSQIAAEVAAQLAEHRGTLPEPVAPEPEVQSAEAPEPEPTTASASPEDQARLIAAEVAAQLADLLRPSVPAEQDVEVEPERTEAVAQEQATVDDLPNGCANDVSGLIPEPFVWENHVNTLRKAAAVKTVAISCHPETWDFLAAQVEGTDHFSKPVNDSNEDTILSGRSTLALLNALRETVCSGLGDGTGIETWTLAVTSYERIAAVINSTRPADNEVGSDRLQQPHIVLDDRSSSSSSSPAAG
ncbi:hypothetical protein [Streptomyces sp. CBMA156]|uniref:hypothetical protein n=1 Tax=Streptomyces sp. CBMA156 TaxID=1930280 RepID=UPI00166214E1|nr:hypothetical protein [Streptomyces sp. CBMA156]MBD0676327.1 hypothetical protein [Streptomyces sp. CBMA156]